MWSKTWKEMAVMGEKQYQKKNEIVIHVASNVFGRKRLTYLTEFILALPITN